MDKPVSELHKKSQILFDAVTPDDMQKCTRQPGCTNPPIGAGIFCDPSHIDCHVDIVCERHKGTAKWYAVDEGPWLL